MKNKFFTLSSLFLLSLASCHNNVEETRTYDDYKSQYITIDEFYAKEGRYGVYTFGKYCHYCDGIKTDVFNYVDSLKENNRKLENLYFFEFKESDNEEGKKQREAFKEKPDNYRDEGVLEKLIQEMINSHPTTLKETYFFFVPAIYVIEDNKLVDYIHGSTNSPNYLKNH